MVNPYDKARELAEAIKESEINKKFQELKKELDSDEETKKMVLDFEEKNIAIERKKVAGEEVSKDEMDKISKLYEILSLNKLANDYLASQYQLGILMQEVSKIIYESVS